MLLFIKGIILGFAIAAPVGPIGILCIQRSLHGGLKIGLMTGAGATLADGVFGSIAAFGLTAVSSLLIAEQFWIRSIGGVYLIYLGIKLFFKSPVKKTNTSAEHSSFHALSSTFLLTLTNPMTILSSIAVFAGLGLGTIKTSFFHSLFLVLGIMAGSALWWILLSSSVTFFLHHRLNETMLRTINRMSGFIILGFGFFALHTLF